MNICLPIEHLNGMDSPIFSNLRAAPSLLIVNSETGAISSIDTTNGVCGAIPADIDALIFSGGIGRGMFNGLQQRGVRVFATEAQSVAEALAQLAAGRLPEVCEAPRCTGGTHTRSESAAGQCGCGSHSQEHAEHGHHHCGCRH